MAAEDEVMSALMVGLMLTDAAQLAVAPELAQTYALVSSNAVAQARWTWALGSSVREEEHDEES